MEKLQYVKPTLKEHGVVRDLTQTGSGGRPSNYKRKTKSRKKKPWWKCW